MIQSFRCSDTEALADGRRVARFTNIESVARRKLRQLQIADRLDDLRVRQNAGDFLAYDRQRVAGTMAFQRQDRIDLTRLVEQLLGFGQIDPGSDVVLVAALLVAGIDLE